MLMNVIKEAALTLGASALCSALGVPRSSCYRSLLPEKALTKRAPPPRTLRSEERQAVLDILHSERFVDQAPAQVWATLLDEGQYLCSIRTMYRILNDNHEVRERRDQLRHPEYTKPELLATAPNQVWSWDITKLKGPAKWTYFYLYVIIDIFSLYVVGWMVASCEKAELATHLIEETCIKQRINPGQLTLHADRGSSMKSKPVAMLLADLGVNKTHSRPYVSDDNPFSESHFHTLKYRPDFPKKFNSIEEARAYCKPFFQWYNEEHRHSGIGLMTPQSVHYNRSEAVIEQRKNVLTVAYCAHPERFVRRAPTPPVVPQAVWINPPKGSETTEEQAQ